MRIALVTDAWTPQVNGVVRTLTEVTKELWRREHEIEVTSPDILTCLGPVEIALATETRRRCHTGFRCHCG